MGRRRKNTFAKALGQLKSTKIDEKIQMLSERPTNSVMTYMTTTPSTLNPDFVSSQRGQDSALSVVEPDFAQDDASENGRDTTGLFKEDGTPRVAMPPGDTSYILGPMAGMFYNYSSPWTRIGYIRQSDRKMVNLGSIVGKLSDWDGSSNFTTYGQLTLAQAQWFKDVQKAPGQSNDPDTYNYRAFYPGPPSSSPDAFGRYYCVITGQPLSDPLDKVGEKEQIPGESGEATADDIFSAIMDRLRKGNTLSKAEKDFLDDYKIGGGDAKKGLFDNWKSQLGKLGLNLLRGFTDAAQFAGDFMFKGLPKGINYLPDFTGGGLGITGGKKWADIIPFGKQLAGSNYATQYFTPSYQKAMQYAKEGGNVVVMPRTPGVQGWKNWLGSDVSRGFGFGDIEKLVQTSDTVANKNLTKIINLSDEGSVEALKALAKSGSKSNAVLAKLGKAVPFLNAGLVAADVTNRVNQGDYFGAVLGAVQIIPGPVGWISLGAQVAYDVEGHFNKNGFKGTVTGSRFESYIIEQQEINTEGMGQALIDAGLPKDKNEFIKQMGVQLTLQGLNPQFVSIILLSMAGKPLSSDQENWVKENIEKMSNMFANAGKKDVKESYLSESRKTSILKNLKNPVVIPETKQKSYKVKPKIRGLNSAIISKPVETPKEYQPKGGRNLWGQFEYDRNVRQSQERKNEVLELVGEGEHAFNYMLTDSRAMNAQQLEKFWGLHPEMYSYFYNGKKFKATRKEALDGDFLVFLVDENGIKSNILQSELNEKLAEEDDRKALEEYNKLNPKSKEPISFEKDYMFKKAYQKLKKEVDYKDKPAKMGYPNDPPPEMVNDRHPDFGKRPGTTLYNKMSPKTAKAMPFQDDPVIDDKIKKARMGEEFLKSDWRSEIEIPDQELVEEKKNFFKRFREIKLDEALANSTSGVLSGGKNIPGAGDVDLFTLQTGLTGDGGIDYGDDGFAGGGEGNSTHTGDGEYTGITNLEPISTAPDPTGVGTRLRVVDYFDGIQSSGTLNLHMKNIPGYKGDDIGRLIAVSGGNHGHISDPEYGKHDGVHEYTIDELGKEHPSYNNTDGLTDRGHGTYLIMKSGGAWGALKPVDTTEMDTIKFRASVHQNNLTDPSYAIQLYYWAGDKPGFQSIADPVHEGKPHDGWRPLYQKPDGTIDDTVSHIIIPDKNNRPPENHNVLVDYDQKIPPWCRGKDTRFLYFGKGYYALTSWGMTSVRFQRRNAITVGAPLDSPEASSFVRLGQGSADTTPEQRKKKVEDMLKASKLYMLKLLGYNDFPGMGATLDKVASSPTSFSDVWNIHARSLGNKATAFRRALSDRSQSYSSRPSSKSQNYSYKVTSKDSRGLTKTATARTPESVAEYERRQRWRSQNRK